MSSNIFFFIFGSDDNSELPVCLLLFIMDTPTIRKCWICTNEKPWRVLSSNCKKWKEIDVGGLIEELCGSERRSYFEEASCTVCLSCANFLPRCCDFFRQLQGRKGSKRCATTPQSTQKRTVENHKENKRARQRLFVSPIATPLKLVHDNDQKEDHTYSTSPSPSADSGVYETVNQEMNNAVDNSTLRNTSQSMEFLRVTNIIDVYFAELKQL